MPFRLSLAALVSHFRVPVRVLAALVQIKLPANRPWLAVGDGSSACVHVVLSESHVEFLAQPRLLQQQLKVILLSLPLSLCISNLKFALFNHVFANSIICKYNHTQT